MPLSDREQKILAEIERHFHAEDPNLVRAVRRIDRRDGNIARWATLGVIAGIVLIAFTINTNTIVSALGFVLVVWCANYLLSAVMGRRKARETDSEESENILRNKGRRRFRRD